jgi:hypothetical protein
MASSIDCGDQPKWGFDSVAGGLATRQRPENQECLYRNRRKRRVVWCGHESDAGYKLGIEFETASPEFWGEGYDSQGVEVPWSK